MLSRIEDSREVLVPAPPLVPVLDSDEVIGPILAQEVDQDVAPTQLLDASKTDISISSLDSDRTDTLATDVSANEIFAFTSLVGHNEANLFILSPDSRKSFTAEPTLEARECNASTSSIDITVSKLEEADISAMAQDPDGSNSLISILGSGRTSALPLVSEVRQGVILTPLSGANDTNSPTLDLNPDEAISTATLFQDSDDIITPMVVLEASRDVTPTLALDSGNTGLLAVPEGSEETLVPVLSLALIPISNEAIFLALVRDAC